MADDRTTRLRELRARLEDGGGPEAIARQHESKKLTARERLDRLFDPGSFAEKGLFAQQRCVDFGMAGRELPGDGVVTGSGRVQGRTVFAASQDFTVVAGTAAEVHCRKFCSILDDALRYGAPVVLIEDSGGARIQEGVDSLNGYGEIFYRNTILSGVVPQLAIVAGPCAGGAVYSPALCDFVIMVKGTSQMFITGPEVIKAVMGEEVTKEDLGGAEAQATRSGVAHFVAEDDADAMRIARKLLSYLPQNNLEEPPRLPDADLSPRPDPALDSLVPEDPRTALDMRTAILSVADPGTFFEVSERFATNFIVGFARLGGRSVGILANQPMSKAGALDIDASDKAARHIRFCNAFNLPVVTFVDVPGFLPGTAQEHGGIIKHGAKLLYAYCEATVPKLTVITRKAYGGAYDVMSSKHIRGDANFAWPSAEIAVMGPKGAVEIIFRSEMEKAPDRAAAEAARVEEYRRQFANPYTAAERGYVDDVIEPRETRRRLCRALEILRTKRDRNPPKKHGNIPL
jgi:propionyl-CoA carboxylase beta chain